MRVPTLESLAHGEPPGDPAFTRCFHASLASRIEVPLGRVIQVIDFTPGAVAYAAAVDPRWF